MEYVLHITIKINIFPILDLSIRYCNSYVYLLKQKKIFNFPIPNKNSTLELALFPFSKKIEGRKTCNL